MASKNSYSPGETRVGWIGTGVMGSSMCRRLIEAGYQAAIYSRTKSKAASLLELGASWAECPRDAAAGADLVFSIVGHPADVHDVLLGDDGALTGCDGGQTLIDMTTSKPSLAVEIAERAASQGVVAIDAPVSGGDVGARNGTLSIMIGGDRDRVEALSPCWETMGSKWVWQGGPGAGQHTKMTNQILVASSMIGVCEALLYGYRAGLNLETVLESVASGAAGSWSLSNLAPRVLANDFDPGFFVEHFLKDLSIVLEECRRMNIALPGTALAQQLYQGVAAQGHEKSGTQALMLALASLSGVDWMGRPQA